MKNIFIQKDPPFIFAILLVAFSWATAHVVTRTIDKPIVEVRSKISSTIPKDIILCSDSTKGTKQEQVLHTYLLTNISKDRLFKDLSLLIIAKDGNIKGVRIRAITPAVSGNIPESCSSEHGLFDDITLHPEWKHQIDVVSERQAKLTLRLNSAPMAINLKKHNIETWLVRNESLVLLIFIVILGILGVLYLIFFAQSQKIDHNSRDERKE